MAKALAVRVRFPAWSASVRSHHLSIVICRAQHLLRSAQNRIREVRLTDSPVVQLRENTRRDSGDVGSIPIGRANFDGPLSLGYR